MSKYYSPEHKAAVLALLKANGGSIALTSRQAAIPARTIRAWRQQQPHQPPPQNPSWQLQLHQLPPYAAQWQPQPHDLPENIAWQRQPQPHDLPEQSARQQFDAQIRHLRDYLMQQIMRLTGTLEIESDGFSLNQRIMALTRLITRLMELDAVYSEVEEKSGPDLRIEYVDQHGRVVDGPPRDFDDDEPHDSADVPTFPAEPRFEVK